VRKVKKRVRKSGCEWVKKKCERLWRCTAGGFWRFLRDGESKQKFFTFLEFLPNHEPTFNMGRGGELDHEQVGKNIGNSTSGKKT
jgi:hypothetical protein